MDIENLITDYLNGNISYFEFKIFLPEVKDFMNVKYQECKNNGIDFGWVKDNTLNWIISLKDSIFKKSSLYNTIFEISKKCNIYHGDNTNYYFKVFEFINNYIPDYLLSEETEDILVKEIYEKSKDFKTKKELKEFVKNKCNELFDLSNSKRPYWVQESEWPVRNNKPCKYIDRKRDGDKVEFRFLDTESNQYIYVTQYY